MYHGQDMYLGLDISTSCTGYAILRADGTIRKLDAWDFKNPKKFPDFFSKARFIKREIRLLQQHYELEHIFIEPALTSFARGKSSATTISTLLKFNGIVSWLCEDETGITPEFIPASTARKKVGIKIPKGEKAKKCVMDFLLQNEQQFANMVTFTPQGNPSPKFFDMADALVIARAGYYLKNGK